MRGTMTKRGRVRKNWKDRFFVLEEGLLSYYESEVLMYKGDDPKGAIMVKQLLPWLAFHGTDDKNGDTGMVVVGEENRALHIIAPTPEVREQWEKALKYAAGMNNMDQEPQTAVVAQDAGCAFWQSVPLCLLTRNQLPQKSRQQGSGCCSRRSWSRMTGTVSSTAGSCRAA